MINLKWYNQPDFYSPESNGSFVFCSEATNSHHGLSFFEICTVLFTGESNQDNLLLTGHQKQCWI